MGFGLLLIGYMFAFVATAGLGPYLFAGMLLGGFLMYLGLTELRKYSPAFIYALIGSILIVICSFFRTAVWIDSYFVLNLGLDSEKVSLIYNWVEFVINFAFNITMLYGVADLSRRVDYHETRQKAYTNMIFVGLFYAFQVVMFLPIAFIESDRSFFLTLLLILQVIYSVVNAWLLFKCYAMICPAGQEDMPRKPSRFAFVNKFREIRDAKEEKAIEDMKNYYEEKLRARNAKRNSKNNHKKKK